MKNNVKNFINFINEQVSEQNIAYHVTRRKNLNSIKKKGLIPSMPKEYGTNGDVKGVYLFKNYGKRKTDVWTAQGYFNGLRFIIFERSERDAAIAYDKKMIEIGKKPVNLLMKK